MTLVPWGGISSTDVPVSPPASAGRKDGNLLERPQWGTKRYNEVLGATTALLHQLPRTGVGRRILNFTSCRFAGSHLSFVVESSPPAPLLIGSLGT